MKQKSLTKEEGGLPWEEDRYFDFYEYNTSDENYSNRKLGDATGEVGPFHNHLNNWYNSHSFFIYNAYPWFIRGSTVASHNGLYVSLFDFSDFHGNTSDMCSFRIVLTP